MSLRPHTARRLAASEAPDRLAAFSIFDEENPLSVINLVPPMMQEAIRKIPDQVTYLTHATEAQIRKEVKPTERDERLRLAFWDEYNYASSVGTQMRINHIIKGCVAVEHFYEIYLKTPKKLAWIITPPKFYSQGMKYILHLGLDRLTEIMQASVVDENGKLDVRAASVILKTFQLVDLRVKGAIMQKVQIDQRTLNMNAEVHAEQLHQMQIRQLQAMSPADLDELEKKAIEAEKVARRFERSMPEEDRKAVYDIMTENKELVLPDSDDLHLPDDDRLPGD